MEKWAKAEPIEGEIVNAKQHNTAVAFSKDGKFLITYGTQFISCVVNYLTFTYLYIWIVCGLPLKFYLLLLILNT